METNKGGKRSGAGRKKLPDGEKRITLIIYPQKKHVDSKGGLFTAKKLALAAIES